jgi:hypothetical protein
MRKTSKTGITGNENESTTMVGSQETTVNTVGQYSTSQILDSEVEFDEECTSQTIEEQEILPELWGHFSDWNGETYMNHFLCPKCFPVNPSGVSGNNTIVNNWYLSSKRRYEECLSEKNYDGVLLEVTKPFRTKWFLKNYKRIFKDVGEKKYYELLGEVLTDVEFHHYTKKSYSRLMSIGSDPLRMMNKSERRMYYKLPERFMIYRGIHSDRKITSENFHRFVGNSWTVDRKISQWFSDRFDSDYKVILSTEISKSQVLSYFTGRKEKEIFVDFEKLDYSQIIIEYVN